jgi:ABC-type branched-subunit amino acid transport system substrate-binding protein
MVAKLKAEGAETTLFFLGSADEAAALLTEAAKVEWVPHVFLPSYAYSSTSTIPLDFVDKIFLSSPSVPQDVTVTGYREYTSLREKYQLPERHRAAQLSALGAAKLFAFAVTKAGRDLTREKLVTALEGLSNFETDFTPKITFGRERRLGARGAYIIPLDVEKKTSAPNAIWVEAN